MALANDMRRNSFKHFQQNMLQMKPALVLHHLLCWTEA